MLYYIESKVNIRVAGISGPFVQTITWLVHGTSVQNAKEKYEHRVKMDHAHMQPQSFEFEYLKIAGEIK